MLKVVAQNKYKLMACIIGLCLLVDVLQHKGQTRVLFPVDFSEAKQALLKPQSKSLLINNDKNWKKGVNSKEQINELNADIAGFECDVYFDVGRNSFDVHHDADKNTGFSLDYLLKIYQDRKLQAGIWLDIKNLDQSNSERALQLLIELRNKFRLQNKLLVESGQASLLTAFSDSGFFTSYYTPFLNPYKISNKEMIVMADSIASVISKSRINALSGYYFQTSFLNHYFPHYPVLTWADNDRFSLVNRLFKRKLNSNKTVLIALYP